jgi:hypothetical protein
MQPNPMVKQIGRFKWWIESDSVLVIQSIEYDPSCYPELYFLKGWGMTPLEVSGGEIELVFFYKEIIRTLLDPVDDDPYNQLMLLGEGKFSDALYKAKKCQRALKSFLL